MDEDLVRRLYEAHNRKRKTMDDAYASEMEDSNTPVYLLDDRISADNGTKLYYQDGMRSAELILLKGGILIKFEQPPTDEFPYPENLSEGDFPSWFIFAHREEEASLTLMLRESFVEEPTELARGERVEQIIASILSDAV